MKKALKTLENQKEWKRIIQVCLSVFSFYSLFLAWNYFIQLQIVTQVTKWMLSKGQGRTMGSYYSLLNALAEDGRIDEAEELWQTLFSQNLESMPRMFFERMISIYYHREMHEKMFEVYSLLTCPS